MRCRWPPWPNGLGDRFRLLTEGARTALPRQQTPRAVVDWSYDLLFEDERLSYADLTEDQQRLFRRLGLHPGTDIDGYAAAPGRHRSFRCPPASERDRKYHRRQPGHGNLPADADRGKTVGHAGQPRCPGPARKA